ncbi:MAG TPA: FG-GAP-like repeat-containing protein [Pyrinomonadaceae bacterium]
MKLLNLWCFTRLLPISTFCFCIFLTHTFADAALLPPGPCRDFSFERPGIVNTAQIHSALVTADLNRDGIPDLVAAIPDLDFVSVFLGNNDGTFQAERNIPAGDSPAGVAIGDVNRDGDLDLVITSIFDQMINIRHGDGAGNFVSDTSHPVFGTIGAALKPAIADLNNDGWPDIAVAASYGLRIFYGSSLGFSDGPDYSITLPATNVAAGHFNSDNYLDLVVVSSGQSFDGGVRVFLNNGTGLFTPGQSFTETTRMRSAIAQDFNNDGKTDIVATGIGPANNIPARLVTFIGNGDGTFAPLPATTNFSIGNITSGDFNNDGKPDIATSHAGIFLNDGSGAFTRSEWLYPLTVPNDVATADFNGDGNLDVAQSNAWRFRMYIYAGLGDGRFPGPDSIPTTTRPDSNVGDFNADGRLDIVTMEGNGTVYLSLQQSDGSFALLGDGPIASSGTSIVTSSNTIEVADFNGDSRPDIAFTVAVFNQIAVLLNNGNNSFTRVNVNLGLPSQRPEALRVGDFNNDNKKDIAVLNRNSNNYTIVLGDGVGAFTILEQQQSIVSGLSTFLAVVDFDVDGKHDLLVGRGTNNLYLFRGNGDGTFAASETIVAPRPLSSMRVTDFNGDNLPDLAATSGGPLASYFLRMINTGTGGFETLEYPVPGSGGDSVGSVVADFDGDGLKDVIVAGLGFPLNTAGILRGEAGNTFAAAEPFENFGGKAFSAADFNNDGRPDYAGIGAVYINNGTREPCLTVADAAVNETDSGTVNLDIPVTLSAGGDQTVTVSYKVVGRNAVATADFDAVTGVLTFTPGTTVQNVSVPIRGDLLDEADEIFNVVLFGASNASIKDGYGTVTIVDNDDAPTIAINDAAIVEGTGGTSKLLFNLNLSGASGRLTKVNFATQHGTATSPSDFAAVAGVLPIEPGTTTTQISVSLTPDSRVEPDETFTVQLSNPVHLSISDGEATGTILNDDIGGNVQFSAATVNVAENAGVATITITRLNGAASDIVVQYSTSDGTAVAGEDYTATSGSVTFGADETSKTFNIPIINDISDEADIETINVNITGVAGGGTVGSPSASVVNIEDDDVSGRAPFDFDGDSKTDIGIFRPTVGEWWYQRSSDGVVPAFQFGASTDEIVPADYTGDGKTDVAFWRPSTGEWYILRSEDSSFYSAPFGTNGDIPAPGDYDNDGKADLAVFRPVSATWFIQRSGDNGTTIQQFGANGDFPVAADYDGDGKADLAIYRPSVGEWWLNRSTAGVIAYGFGNSTDKAVPGDYTGDGKSDVAFWRPSTGEWYILRSEDTSFYSAPFGTTGDIPAPGDYDGDGKFDVTVFRPSAATWFSQRTTAGTLIQQFGANGDEPVPNAFVR